MKQHLESLLRDAVIELHSDLSSDIALTLERPRDPTHGDWSCTIAMVLAKSMRVAPRDLAARIIALIPAIDCVEKIDIAGPGFINITLTTDYFNQQLDHMWSSSHCGSPSLEQKETVIVDYSSPNLAKEMHVGHLRSTIIGDAIARILEFKGITVIRQNHIGDWGTQFGMLLAHMNELQQDNDQTFNLNDLESFYKAAKQRFDAEPTFADNARAWVVKLQAHDPHTLELWTQFIDLSLTHCQTIYQRLGVSLSKKDIRAESAYNDALPKIVDQLREQQLLSDQDGTQCVFLDQFKAKDQSPLPIIVQKKDGGYLYATTDLAALQFRHQVLHADRILYVVDSRQALHFQQIFSLARKAGFVSETMQLEHIDFGMILDKAGRPFKSRDGGVTKLIDLLDEAVRRADILIAEKNTTLSDTQRHIMAETIGIAAVKYADLSKNRISDYVFDWDTMLSFEGNTAPYLLYANTRIHSLFHKAELSPNALKQTFKLQAPQEISLGKHLALFPEIIDSVITKASPHLLCTYLYELAGLFSSFYEACPILSSENQALKHNRLKLAGLSSKVLEQGLALLGIQTLKKM